MSDTYFLFTISGKCLENVRKHTDIKLVQTEKKLRKIAAKPTFKCFRIFNEDLIGIECKRVKVKLCKPAYCGFSILDLSKHAMYEFYYQYLKAKYDERVTLQFTDTDSFLFHCVTDDIYMDMQENIDLFDTSNFPQPHFLHSNKNKKVLNKMKSETADKPILEFVGLRAKQYSFIYIDVAKDKEMEERKCKGISKVTIKNDLKHELYKRTLFEETEQLSKMCLIRSCSHVLTCDQIQKKSLSCYDDKRYLLECGIKSLAYNHCDIT